MRWIAVPFYLALLAPPLLAGPPLKLEPVAQRRSNAVFAPQSVAESGVRAAPLIPLRFPLTDRVELVASGRKEARPLDAIGRRSRDGGRMRPAGGVRVGLAMRW
jgi:hypothetical protein